MPGCDREACEQSHGQPGRAYLGVVFARTAAWRWWVGELRGAPSIAVRQHATLPVMSHKRATQRPRSRRTAVALSVGLLVLTAVGCSSSPGSKGGGSNFVGGDGTVIRVAPDKRLPAPNLVGKTVAGGETSLAAYKGKVVVLNVWGSWCAPCRAEAPDLVKVANAEKAEGVQFLGINTHDLSRENAASFVRRFKVPYPNFYDPYGKLITAFPKGTLNPQAIPSTVVIDRQGRIAARALAPLGEDSLHQMIDPVVSGK